MKTIQMTIDDGLLTEVDQAVAELQTNRSAFMREALLAALRRLRMQTLEAQHRRGYTQHPVQPDEFDGWESEQVWGARMAEVEQAICFALGMDRFVSC